jgi:reactive chlorine resistance protein C
MKNTYTNEPSRSAALAGALNRPGIEILRNGLVIVLLWIGGMKFTSYEAAGIAPLEMHSPLMNWLYVLMGQRNVSDSLGVVKIALGIGIALRYVYPLVSGIASLLSVGMFLTTLSFLFTTPGWEPTLGFPGISAMPGQFLLKDVVLLGAAIFTASEAFRAVHKSETAGIRNALPPLLFRMAKPIWKGLIATFPNRWRRTGKNVPKRKQNLCGSGY